MPTAENGLPPGWVRCAATTLAGKPCRKAAQEGWVYCGSHRHLRTTDLPGGTVSVIPPG